MTLLAQMNEYSLVQLCNCHIKYYVWECCSSSIKVFMFWDIFLLGCDTALLGKQFLVSQGNAVPSSLRV